MIDIKTITGDDTDITVSVINIHGGAMKMLVITDEADQQQVGVYDDEIDNLIEALLKAKELLV